jgi:hypothetical protein
MKVILFLVRVQKGPTHQVPKTSPQVNSNKRRKKNKKEKKKSNKKVEQIFRTRA